MDPEPNSTHSTDADRFLEPGTRVVYNGTGAAEHGIVVHCWIDETTNAYDCYVAFFGTEFPSVQPEEKPYLLRYFSASLAVVEPEAGTNERRLVGPNAIWGQLPTQLKEWTDIDLAQFLVGQAIGIFPEDATESPEYSASREKKAIFWTDNPKGNLLASTLRGMEADGVLEFRSEPDLQFRWAT